MIFSKTVKYSLVLIVILIFFTYFMAQKYIFDSGQVVIDKLEEISIRAEQGNWEEANQSINEFQEYWRKVQFFVAFNNAEQDFSEFEQAVSLIKGGIKAENYPLVAGSTVRAKNLWKNFMRIVPLP